MAQLKWFFPTPQQIKEAEAIAKRIGEVPYWEGDVLCVGQPEPAEPAPDPEPTRRDHLIAAGFSETQAEAILAALG